jgi:hypothetical protein
MAARTIEHKVGDYQTLGTMCHMCDNGVKPAKRHTTTKARQDNVPPLQNVAKPATRNGWGSEARRAAGNGSGGLGVARAAAASQQLYASAQKRFTFCKRICKYVPYVTQ